MSTTSKGPDFWNANGLVDGNIPAGKECPWKHLSCFNDGCPAEENGNIRKRPYSCAFARAQSLVELREKDV